MYARMHVHARKHTHTHARAYTYTYMYICLRILLIVASQDIRTLNQNAEPVIRGRRNRGRPSIRRGRRGRSERTTKFRKWNVRNNMFLSFIAKL